MKEHLIEYQPFDYRILEEASAGKRMRVEGKVQHGGKRNANGREYPIPVLERECGKLMKMIDGLEDNDDVQEIFTNEELVDDVLKALEG